MPASNFRDYYQDLELAFGASQDEIKYALSKLKMRYHPNNNNPGTSDAVKYRQVGEAFARLSDPYSKPDYDKGYHFFKEEADRASIEVGEAGGTRTEQFDADQPFPRPSPPPVKPHREGDEDGWIYRGEEYRGSQAYKEWEKKAEEYLARHPEREYQLFNRQPGGMSHGLEVPVKHRAADQPCTLRSEEWYKETGADVCIFCIRETRSVTRCPSCHALACPGCLRRVKVKEEEETEDTSSQ